jgi:phosphonatase-like hydrolase
MQEFKVVVFDIAGTTVQDNGKVALAFMDAFEHYRMPVSGKEVGKVMGYRKADAIRILLKKFYPGPNGDMDHQISRIHTAFTENMIRMYEEDKDLRPLPHALEIFSWLRENGIKRALNTGFTKKITDTILSKLGWEQGTTVDYVVSSDEVEKGRPSPDMIRRIMKQLNVPDASLIVKVGDTEVDVEEGRNAGCGLVVSVTTGAYSREQLKTYHPDRIIDDLSELKSFIHFSNE